MTSAKYRHALPQLGDKLFLTAGGIETTLIFHEGLNMVNRAHPTHFAGQLGGGAWMDRIGGLRARASKLSHAELDASPVLAAGDSEELARDYRSLSGVLRNLRVLVGCCGTDHRPIGSISHACDHARAA